MNFCGAFHEREGAMKHPVASGNRNYREMLLSKRHDVLAGLGMKFDTLARMGRVAEEDQAQITHDEFVSLRLNRLDYLQLRMIEEALDRLNSGDFGTCLACDWSFGTFVRRCGGGLAAVSRALAGRGPASLSTLSLPGRRPGAACPWGPGPYLRQSIPDR